MVQPPQASNDTLFIVTEPLGAAAVLFAAALLLCYLAGAAFERAKVSRPCVGMRLGSTEAGLFTAAALCAGWGCFLLAYAPHAAPFTPLIFIVLTLLAAMTFGLGTKRRRPFNSVLFSALGSVVSWPVRAVLRTAGLSDRRDITEDEVKSFVENVEEQALIDESQKEMITNIFELSDVSAGQMMTHRTEIVSLMARDTVEQAVELARREGVSRIPVCGKNLDDIVGMLHVKDLFRLWDAPERNTLRVSQFMRKAIFVPETCPAGQLLVQFQHMHTQIAVVIDEYGGTSGLVTMEDILEEIVGDMQDEFDNEEAELRPCENGVTAVGEADLEELFEMLGKPLPEPEEDDEEAPDTVGGLVTGQLGRIPDEDEHPEITWGGVCFRVMASDERHITQVYCFVPQPAPAGEEPDAAAKKS